MTTRCIVVPASYEQGEQIMEHHLRGGAVTIISGEKERLVRAAQRKFPGCRVVGAELDIENADWTLTIEHRSTVTL